jgi:hypothetical protein
VVSKRNPGLCSPEIQTRRGTCRVADLTARYKLPAVSLPPAAVLRTNHISNHTQTSPGPKHKQHFSSQSPPSPEEDFAGEASTTGKPARPSFTRSLRWPASLLRREEPLASAVRRGPDLALSRFRRGLPCVRQPLPRLDSYEDSGILFAKIRFNRRFLLLPSCSSTGSVGMPSIAPPSSSVARQP